ncbi:MAG: DUF2851 family protein [Calditrichaeota bacterium]|nr:DUF2851 family protein [Calditrichota bacterium]
MAIQGRSITSIPEHWMHLTYRHPEWLQEVWFTIDRKPLRVLQPGTWNRDNGPDFLDALIEVDGVRYRGDVECHLRLADWYGHGHHQDRRYQRVVLHLLWEPPSAVPPDLTARCFHVVLSRQLRIPIAHWRASLQRLEQPALPLNPLPEFPSPETLARLAWQRLENKVTRLASWVRQHGFGHTLYLVLAEALGYTRNKDPFRQLMVAVPPGRLSEYFGPLEYTPWRIWLYLAMRADLLPTIPQRTHKLHPEEQQWLQRFRQQGHLPVLRRWDWHFSRMRPLNQPALRLALLANWLSRFPGDQLFEHLLEAGIQRQPFRDVLARWRQALCQPVPVHVGRRIQQLFDWHLPQPLQVGEQRFRQLIINGLLPLLLLWARRTDSLGFEVYLEAMYEAFPSCETAARLRQCLAAVPSPVYRPPLERSGFFQQGLYQWLALNAAPASAQVPITASRPPENATPA